MMKFVMPAAVLLLMLSIGMSISLKQLVDNWARLGASGWIRLWAATFFLPPLIALALGCLLPLGTAATAGLFLVAVAPGAPLMTRHVAQKGFDMQLAASYQVWGALLTPVMIPLLVAAGAWLYGRQIWVSPAKMFKIVALQQFLPLLAGMTLMRLSPGFSNRARKGLILGGNVLLTAGIAGILFKLGPALTRITPWVALAAPALAAGCLFSVPLLFWRRSPLVQTLSISNTNRHVGIALLLSGQNIQDQRPIPAIVVYALAATLTMTLYGKIAREKAIVPAS